MDEAVILLISYLNWENNALYNVYLFILIKSTVYLESDFQSTRFLVNVAINVKVKDVVYS